MKQHKARQEHVLKVLKGSEPGDRRTCILLLINGTFKNGPIINLSPPRFVIPSSSTTEFPPLLPLSIQAHLLSAPNDPMTPFGSRPSSALTWPWGPAQLVFHTGFLSLCIVDIKFLLACGKLNNALPPLPPPPNVSMSQSPEPKNVTLYSKTGMPV